MFQGIHTVIFYVKDINVSKDFYVKLGFELSDDQGNYVLLKVSNKESVFLALNAQKRHASRIGLQTVILKSENIDKTYNKLKNDVNVLSELTEKPWGETFTFTDPDGNKIEVLQ